MGLQQIQQRVQEKAQEYRKELPAKLITLLCFGFSFFFLWTLIRLLWIFYGFNTVEWIKALPILGHITTTTTQGSLWGAFYLSFFSSLFFVPAPEEAVFLLFLEKNNAWLLMIVVILGQVITQHLNYAFGYLFGPFLKRHLKKKTRRKMRKRLEHYGAYAIFFMHFLPLPFPLFNVIVGMARYHYGLWVTLMILSLIAKHLVLMLLFV